MCTVQYAHKNMLQQFQTQYTRAHNYILKKPMRCVSTSFAARIIRDWNNLANNSVHAKSINIFKAKLRHEWINHTELYIFILITPSAVKSSLYISLMTVQFLTQPVSILYGYILTVYKVGIAVFPRLPYDYILGQSPYGLDLIFHEAIVEFFQQPPILFGIDIL